MKFGDKIKQLREEKNLSRDEFAKIMGVTYHAMSKYETNERQPDYDLLKNIAKYFGVTTDYLLGISSIRNPEIAKVAEEKGIYNVDLDKIKIAAHDQGGKLVEVPVGLKELIKEVVIEVREERLMEQIEKEKKEKEKK